MLLLEGLEAALVTAAQLRRWTGKDPVLVKVR